MDGDFKGDFSRDSFAFDSLRLRQFSRVLMQQGRVQLDADWNEQVDILLSMQRKLITDLFGPYWGTFDFEVDPPSTAGSGGIRAVHPNSFKIDLLRVDGTVQNHDLSIGSGHYYVDGILVENVAGTGYQKQEPKQPVPGDEQYLVYLDVWERQITFLEDSDIREIALGENGPDTATRAEVVWQVKLMKPEASISSADINSIGTDAFKKIQFVEDSTIDLKKKLQPDSRGQLKARGKAASKGDTNPCITPPDARFRGDENQLYRVEIHTGGTLKTATFKWSRENGSVIFPIVSLNPESNTVILENLGRDSHLSLEVGDWVEIVDDDYLLRVATLQGQGSTQPQGDVNPLLRVEKIEADKAQPANVLVTLKNASGDPLKVPIGQDPRKHPLLRRWDQRAGKRGDGPKLLKDGTIQMKEGTTEDSWITLEDGVQIQFQPGEKITGGLSMTYRTGDYWLIPARTTIGDVFWPQENDSATNMPYQFGHPKALPPHGVEHHYALLALSSFSGSNVEVQADLRYMIPPLGKMAVPLNIGAAAGLSIDAFRNAGL